MNENNITTAIADYEPITAALAGIEKYRGLIFDVSTTQGMKEAKAAYREVAQPRIALEKARVKLKADVLERGRLIDGEAKRIGALFAAIEDPIKAQIERQELAEEAARQAAIRAEQERLEAEARAKKEAEERALAEQRAEIARQRAALEAEERERRRKLDEEERASRRRIEEEEARARATRQAEEDRIRAERERLDAERRAKEEVERQARLAEEERQRQERDAREAAEREQRRKEQEQFDSRKMLETFCERFGHLHPWLARHIKAYLEQQNEVAA